MHRIVSSRCILCRMLENHKSFLKASRSLRPLLSALFQTRQSKVAAAMAYIFYYYKNQDQDQIILLLLGWNYTFGFGRLFFSL